MDGETREQSRGQLPEHEHVLEDLRAREAALEAENRELRAAKLIVEQACRRFEELYDLAPTAYFTFDAGGFVLDVNRAGAALLAEEPQKLVGRSFPSLLPCEPPAAFWNHLERAAQQAQPVTSELRFRCPAQGPVVLQVSSVQVRDGLGRAVAFRTSFTDITERKRAEAALQCARLEEERLRRRFELLDSASVMLTQALSEQREHGAEGVCRAVVDLARQLTGAELAALGVCASVELPMSPWAFSAAEPERYADLEKLPAARALLEEVARLGRPLRTEDLARVGAAQALGSFLAVILHVGGRVEGLLCLSDKAGGGEFSDEDELLLEMFAERAALALEVARLNGEVVDAVRARDNLLAVVAHDLRNPLQAILVSTSVLARRDAESDRRRSRKQLETIVRSSTRMKRLLDDLLQAENIKAGTFTVVRRPQPLAPIIEDVLQELDPLATQKALTLSCELARELPPMACDRQRVHQVLHNLVGNAIKFVPDGGVVTVRARVVDGEAQVSVADDGPGIPVAVQDRLFDRFWRDETMERAGAGLGLFISRGIVEAHGGRLWVDSTPGAGSTFTFTLPLAG